MRTTTKMIIEWAKRVKQNNYLNRVAIARNLKKYDHQTRRDMYINATNLIECPQ